MDLSSLSTAFVLQSFCKYFASQPGPFQLTGFQDMSSAEGRWLAAPDTRIKCMYTAPCDCRIGTTRPPPPPPLLHTDVTHALYR